jgi:hypothetical protein
MRNVTMATAYLIALLVALGGSVAVAQNSTRNGGSMSTGTVPQSSTYGGPPAPVGHRQPRAGDVPSEKGAANLDAEDAALDRKIKSICRGC